MYYKYPPEYQPCLSGTNPAGYPTPPPYPEAGSGQFPIDDEIDDATCGAVFYEPVISNFDYVAQDEFVRNGEIGNFSAINEVVVNGEEVVPYSFPWQVRCGVIKTIYVCIGKSLDRKNTFSTTFFGKNIFLQKHFPATISLWHK